MSEDLLLKSPKSARFLMLRGLKHLLNGCSHFFDVVRIDPPRFGEFLGGTCASAIAMHLGLSN